MASKRKKTIVAQLSLYGIPDISLRILAFLIENCAYSRDKAVNVATIARSLDLDPGEVAFDCLELFAKGFAVLTVPTSANPANTSAYIETDAGEIREYARRLESQAAHLTGRAEQLGIVASAMKGCCHRWSV